MDELLVSPSVSTSSNDPGFLSPVPSQILKDVVAYVEVRTNNDNRSAAIKWVLERMGAKVEEKFAENVTHVVFKEGRKRTRDKALKLGVHLVSVLWVDSCKEKQQKVAEGEFCANTERCGTPPPGIRWKKFKSMQPMDFEDEVARSAERYQKRQRRRDKHLRQLLQGGESATPFHSPAHVLVVDTQPQHSPFPYLGIQTPVVIPNTPLCMQARLNQLKEARRNGETVESPLCKLDLPSLQRTLFKDQTPSQDKAADKTPAHSRRSTRLSVHLSKHSSSGGLSEMQTSSQSSDHTKTSSSSQLRGDAKVMSRTEALTDFTTSDTESVGSELGEKDRHRTRSSPENGLPSQNPPQTQGIQKRKVSRQNMLCRLPQTFLHPSSQSDKQSTQQSDDIRQDSTAVCSQSITGQNVSMRPNSVGSQGVGHKRDSTTVEEHKKDSTTVEKITRKAKAKKSDRRKTQSDACFTKRSSQKARTNSEGSGGDLVSQEKSHVSEGAGSDVSSSKSVNKKRKLLNPSQEFHVLSPSPTDSPNLPKTAEERPVKERRGRKRKSCDMDAVFPPSSLPAPKRGRGLSQMKENHSKRMSSTQADASSSDPSRSQSSLKGKKRNVANGKKSVQKSNGDESVSSSLHSTARSSSILGSSMSMVFNDSSRGSLSRLAPPRNSLAEFKVAKPQPQRQRQGKRAPPGSKGGSSSSQEMGRDPRVMSLHKFRLTGMPSLVLTSLHRQEQDFVIHAVKKLGVFRVEDRVSKHTTHIVSGEPRRTLNVLNAMARGCWLVDRQWVIRSMEDGRWLGEEDYEMVEDFPQCKATRLAREAEDPSSYQCRVFELAGSMFVSNECTPPRTELIKLLQLCGAKVTDSIQRADFYIGDSAHDEKNSIKPVWVLDCISEQELLPMDDYILAINHKAKISSSPEF